MFRVGSSWQGVLNFAVSICVLGCGVGGSILSYSSFSTLWGLVGKANDSNIWNIVSIKRDFADALSRWGQSIFFAVRWSPQVVADSCAITNPDVFFGDLVCAHVLKAIIKSELVWQIVICILAILDPVDITFLLVSISHCALLYFILGQVWRSVVTSIWWCITSAWPEVTLRVPGCFSFASESGGNQKDGCLHNLNFL
mgnify:CR=1 FL=1